MLSGEGRWLGCANTPQSNLQPHLAAQDGSLWRQGTVDEHDMRCSSHSSVPCWSSLSRLMGDLYTLQWFELRSKVLGRCFKVFWSDDVIDKVNRYVFISAPCGISGCRHLFPTLLYWLLANYDCGKKLDMSDWSGPDIVGKLPITFKSVHFFWVPCPCEACNRVCFGTYSILNACV